MNGTVLLKWLLSQQGSKQDCIKFLPPKTKQQLAAVLCPADASPLPALLTPQAFAKVHYSWFLPLLQTAQPSTYPLYFSLFSKEQTIRLAASLKVPAKVCALPRIMRSVFIKEWTRYLKAQQVVPVEFLPLSPMNAFLKASKNMLVNTLQYLGLMVFSEELKFVVDKHVLAKVYEILPPGEAAFLKSCLRKNNQLKSKDRLLDFLAEPSVFLRRIHQKGIAFFAKALCGEDESLVWYILHTLDRARGMEIARHLDEKGAKRFKSDSLNVLSQVLGKEGIL